jgi:Trypsin-like peptidase domain
MTGKSDLKALLARCTVRLDTDHGPQGTAFFVAPGYAVTASHVVDGREGLGVWLHSRAGSWRGHVESARPSADAVPGDGRTYAPPDVALIRIDEGPEHLCALLADHLPDDNLPVFVRGHTRTFDTVNVTAETESFTLTGELETPDPGCTLFKLGHGQAVNGMSGAPVLSQLTGEVIGMLRTSRSTSSSLGGWVVPSQLICDQWPEQLSTRNTLPPGRHELWRQAARQLGKQSSPEGQPPAGAGSSIGTIHGDIGAAIFGGTTDTVNVTMGRAEDRRRGHPGSGAQ